MEVNRMYVERIHTENKRYVKIEKEKYKLKQYAIEP